MRPAEHLVTAARRRVLSAPGVVVGSWDVHALRSHSMVRLVPHCQVQTSYLWVRHARGCMCMCSIYFVLSATSFNLYEGLSTPMQGMLSASARLLVILSSRHGANGEPAKTRKAHQKTREIAPNGNAKSTEFVERTDQVCSEGWQGSAGVHLPR